MEVVSEWRGVGRGMGEGGGGEGGGGGGDGGGGMVEDCHRMRLTLNQSQGHWDRYKISNLVMNIITNRFTNVRTQASLKAFHSFHSSSSLSLSLLWLLSSLISKQDAETTCACRGFYPARRQRHLHINIVPTGYHAGWPDSFCPGSTSQCWKLVQLCRQVFCS